MGKLDNFKRYLGIGMVILVFLIYPVCGQPVFGDSGTDFTDPKTIFEQANSEYQKGNFNKAAELYQQLCDEGYQSGNMYYNLGNTYYKMGLKGRAVLNYERARRQIPGDADLKANLNYVLTGVQEGVSDWKYDFVKFLTGMLSVQQLALSGSIWFFGLVIIIILAIIKPIPLHTLIEGDFKKWWIGLVTGCAIIFVSFLSLGILTFWEQSREQAVAVKAGDVFFEPSKAATIYYHLAEGSRVLILEEKENWVKVKRVDGKRGWMDKECLETI